MHDTEFRQLLPGARRTGNSRVKPRLTECQIQIFIGTKQHIYIEI